MRGKESREGAGGVNGVGRVKDGVEVHRGQDCEEIYMGDETI